MSVTIYIKQILEKNIWATLHHYAIVCYIYLVIVCELWRQKFHQYQQNEHPTLTSKLLIPTIKTTTYIYVAKSIGACKKKSLYNQPKPYFFKKWLCSHYWIDFNKFYTKNIQNCLYFDCLFAHFVYMSGFYLYIIQTQQIKIDWFSYIFQLKINPKN